MSPPRLAAAAALIVAALGVPAAGQSPVALRDTVLANGLHVIAVPNPVTPIATLEVVIRAGAFTQVEPEDEGLPHILEHLLFKSYGRGEGFGADAADADATYNGTTGAERVTYYVTLGSEQTERGIELLAELVEDPRFDREYLEDELQVVRGELERMASDPLGTLDLAADRVLWGSAFATKNAIGNIITILGAEPDRLRDHYRRFYVPNNAALIASGDVDAAEVFRWAADHFGGWRRAPDPFESFVSPEIAPLAGDTAFVIDATAAEVTFVIKWHGPSVSGDPVGSLAADVFSTMFNQATSGTQRRLVDSGLFQSVGLSYETVDRTGPVSLFARTTQDELARAITELGIELFLLSDPTYFDDADLEAAKRALRVSAAIDRFNPMSEAHWLATVWAVGGLDYYRAYEPGLQNVTAEDVRTYVRRYLATGPKVVAVLGPTAVERQLAPVIHQVVRGWPRRTQ